jgi:hypothetical protein
MEKHVLPADDKQVEDLTCDILEALACGVGEYSVNESTETGEAVVTLANGRRFRLQLIETQL